MSIGTFTFSGIEPKGKQGFQCLNDLSAEPVLPRRIDTTFIDTYGTPKSFSSW